MELLGRLEHEETFTDQYRLDPLQILPIELNQIDRFCELLSLTAIFEPRLSKNNMNWAECTPHGLLSRFRLDELFVIKAGDEFIAALVLSSSFSEHWPKAEKSEALYLNRLAVSPDRWGMGIASELCNWAAQQADDCGVHYVRICLGAAESHLTSFFKRLGFEVVNKIGRTDGVTRLQMPLKPELSVHQPLGFSRLFAQIFG